MDLCECYKCEEYEFLECKYDIYNCFFLNVCTLTAQFTPKLWFNKNFNLGEMYTTSRNMDN